MGMESPLGGGVGLPLVDGRASSVPVTVLIGLIRGGRWVGGGGVGGRWVGGGGGGVGGWGVGGWGVGGWGVGGGVGGWGVGGGGRENQNKEKLTKVATYEL